MASFNFLENDFTGGQISPLLDRRSSAKRYQNGLKTLQNMMIVLQGGVTSRPGFEFVAQVKDSSAYTRLIDFQFSTTENYIIETGNQYFRFYKESGQILESDITITGITEANPGVVTTSGSHGLSSGDQVYITEVAGMTEINHPKVFYTVGSTTSTTFNIQDQDGVNLDTSTGYTTYSSGGVVNKIYEISHPYATADIQNLAYTQSADVISIVHEDYSPRDLTRTADTSWTLTETEFVDGPYLEINTSPTTLGPSSTGTSVTFTASGTAGINNGEGFKSTDVGRLIRWKDGTDWFYYEITAFNSTTSVDADKKSDGTPAGISVTVDWRLGAWSDTTGWPRAITYHQQRRFYAGTTTQPDTIWGSAIDDFTNFTPGVEDADAVEYIIASNKVNAIYWLASSNRLRVGTEGGIYTLWGGSTTSSLTPTNVEADPENNLRAKRLRPIDLGNVTIFAQRSGKVLRELAYDFQSDGLVAPDITLVSENILGDTGDIADAGVTEMAFQQEPIPIVWCAKDDGNLAGLTYSRETDTVGWHNHIIGGTSPDVESVAVVPGSGQDRVWVQVKRTINGVTRRFIERQTTQFRNTSNKLAKFSDSFVNFTGEEPATTLTPGATTGDGVTFTAGSSIFTASDVGRVIQNGRSGGKAKIVTQSGTTCTANILRDFSSTDAIASGAWTLSNNTYDKLDHLEGESVSVLADGGTKPKATVTNGSITLSNQYTDVTIGLGYTQEIETLDIDFGSQVGTAFGSRSKINEVGIYYFESVGGFIGYDSDSLTEIVFREGTDIMNEGVPLFTGLKSLRPKGGWRDKNKTLIRQTDPLPMTILGMVVKGQVSDQTG